MVQRLDRTTWMKHLERADSEEISLAEYARREGLKASRLYHWRRLTKTKCKAKDKDNPSKNLIKVVPVSEPKAKLSDQPPTPSVTLNLFIFTEAPTAELISSLSMIGRKSC